MRWSITAAAVFAATVIIAACSAPVSGNPEAAPTASELQELAAVGPCEMVGEATRAQFSLDAGRETPEPVVVGSRECTWRTSEREVYYVAVLPARMNMDSVMRGYEVPVVSTVAGRRAATTYSSATFKDLECLLFVEVAGTRLLNFQYEPAVDEKSSTHAQVCEKTTAFAEQVMAGL
jgi:hypothetical protein